MPESPKTKSRSCPDKTDFAAAFSLTKGFSHTTKACSFTTKGFSYTTKAYRQRKHREGKPFPTACLTKERAVSQENTTQPQTKENRVCGSRNLFSRFFKPDYSPGSTSFTPQDSASASSSSRAALGVTFLRITVRYE